MFCMYYVYDLIQIHSSRYIFMVGSPYQLKLIGGCLQNEYEYASYILRKQPHF